MIRLRLTHGLSHDNGYVSATQRNPVVTVEDEAAARYCVDSGFFEVIDNDGPCPGQKGVQEPPKEKSEANTSNAGNAATEAAAPGQGKSGGTDEALPFDELDVMSVAELKAYAEMTGVNIGKLTKKADIIAAIREAEAETK